MSVAKRIIFSRKQRAIRDALRIGDQIIRRNRRMLLASTFNAWKLRAGIYRQVAARFQASLEVTLRWAWSQWRTQIAVQVCRLPLLPFAELGTMADCFGAANAQLTQQCRVVLMEIIALNRFSLRMEQLTRWS